MTQYGKQISDEEKKGLPARVDISNAYAFIKGSETQDSLAAITFEEMLQAQVDRLEGKNGGRSSIERINEIESRLDAVVEQAKEQEESNVDAQDNVNTEANAGQ